MALTETALTPSNTLPATTSQPNGGAVAANGGKQKPGYANAGAFELMQRAATALSRSTLVPKEYQNNIPNCMIALGIADRIGADPMMVMQNLDIIHGRPSWRAQFLIGTANSCGRFSAIRYEFFGAPNTDAWGCRASATEKSTGEKLVGPDITMAIAKNEGWYGKKDSKWKTIPQLMLMYRSGAWWVRAYAPELSLGFHTAEEVMDIIDITPAPATQGQSLVQAAAMLGARSPATPHDPETGEILDQQAEDAGEAVLADEVAQEAEDTIETALERGMRLLATCATQAAVHDLHKTIMDELSEDADRDAWGDAVIARVQAVKGRRP